MLIADRSLLIADSLFQFSLQRYKKKLNNANNSPKKLLECVQVHKFVDYGVDSESGRGVDVQFACYVFAVRNNGVHGYVQHIGNLFVAQPFYDLNEYVSFAFAQFLRFCLYASRMAFRSSSGLSMSCGWSL